MKVLLQFLHKLTRECINTASHKTKVSVRVSPRAMLWWSEQYIC